MCSIKAPIAASRWLWVWVRSKWNTSKCSLCLSLCSSCTTHLQVWQTRLSLLCPAFRYFYHLHCKLSIQCGSVCRGTTLQPFNLRKIHFESSQETDTTGENEAAATDENLNPDIFPGLHEHTQKSRAIPRIESKAFGHSTTGWSNHWNDVSLQALVARSNSEN